LALCFTESSLRKDVKHFYSYVVGYCGIDKRYWSKDLKENNIPINSLKAGEYVLNYYLDKHNGNKLKAISDYKGIITQHHLARRVLEIEKKLKENK
jgi:hypothetical protein